MAITLIGPADTASRSDGGALTLNFTPTLLEGDVAVVIYVAGRQQSYSAGFSTSGYTITHMSSGTGGTPRCFCGYKVMGPVPDTGVTSVSHPSGQDGVAMVAMLFRGVDPTTPMDVTPAAVEEGTTNGLDPNPPSITPVTAGAEIVTGYGGRTLASVAPVVAPAGYSDVADALGTDTYMASAAIARKNLATAAPEDPGIFDVAEADMTKWVAFTLALRPLGGGAPPSYLPHWRGKGRIIQPGRAA